LSGESGQWTVAPPIDGWNCQALRSSTPPAYTHIVSLHHTTQATLTEAGMQLDDLVALTVFVTQPAFVPAWHVEAVRELGETQLPTMQVTVVSGLSTPGAALELSGYAAK